MRSRFELIAVLAAAAALLLWFMARTVRKAEDPAWMFFKWMLTLPLAVLALGAVHWFGFEGPFIIAFCGIGLSLLWTPHLGAALAKPITSLFDGGDEPPDLRPLYSVALARQKRGEYHEAIAEVQKQLARFPKDFEGQMLLAQIQAEDLKDLAAAEITIQSLCDQQGHAPKNITFALFSLADWHLKFTRDRPAARRSLEKILLLLPNTEFALTAAQRIAHLGDVNGPIELKKFIVPEGVKNLGLARVQAAARQNETDPGVLAAEFVKHLEQHPHDTEIREKLARIYGEHYGRLDLAADQLEQMIAEPNHPPKAVVHWLNALADLQVQAGADFETIRQTLQRIIDRAPNLAAAEGARTRINLLRLEMKGKERNPTVKLGVYEQNIGLKHGPAYGKGGRKS